MIDFFIEIFFGIRVFLLITIIMIGLIGYSNDSLLVMNIAGILLLVFIIHTVYSIRKFMKE